MFRQQFGDFREKFGLRNVLDGIFSENMDSGSRQEFLERLVKLWSVDYEPSETIKNLYSFVKDKPYFILTTNADEHLEAAGFCPEKVWEIEGTFRTTLKNENDYPEKSPIQYLTRPVYPDLHKKQVPLTMFNGTYFILLIKND